MKLGDYLTRKEYNFNIKGTSYVKTYKDGDTTVEISPLGVSISAKESSEAYKGKSKSYQYILKFKNLLDISKIEKIEFNGKSE